MNALASWAAIFDWDGVILDSSRHHEQAWQELAREERRTTPPGFFRKSFGMKNEKVLTELLGWTQDAAEVRRLSQRKEELYRKLLLARGAVALPGVLEWLRALATARVPCAIASSTSRANIECVLDALQVRAFFAAVVAGEDVRHGKPDPEVFLLAAQRLQTPPARCVVFEDAHVGIEAALAAGMRVVAVATTHPPESLRRAHWVVRRLDELSVAALAAELEPGGNGQETPSRQSWPARSR